MNRKKKFIAGNWKMNHCLSDIIEFTKNLKTNENCHQWIAPQYIHLLNLKDLTEGSAIKIGAQNSSNQNSGALTGEISPKALKDISAHFVIIGHSERRAIFGEENSLLREKVILALENDLNVIYCVGESLDERESNKTEAVLKKQLLEGLKGIESLKLLIAYEPVWAIGTGKTATPEMAQEAHKFIRELTHSSLSLNAENLPILYGGSVKPNNAQGLLSQIDIDGALVGGASLKAEDYNALCEIAASLKKDPLNNNL